jgi:hypothetical protein
MKMDELVLGDHASTQGLNKAFLDAHENGVYSVVMKNQVISQLSN